MAASIEVDDEPIRKRRAAPSVSPASTEDVRFQLEVSDIWSVKAKPAVRLIFVNGVNVSSLDMEKICKVIQRSVTDDGTAIIMVRPWSAGSWRSTAREVGLVVESELLVIQYATLKRTRTDQNQSIVDFLMVVHPKEHFQVKKETIVDNSSKFPPWCNVISTPDRKGDQDFLPALAIKSAIIKYTCLKDRVLDLTGSNIVGATCVELNRFYIGIFRQLEAKNSMFSRLQVLIDLLKPQGMFLDLSTPATTVEMDSEQRCFKQWDPIKFAERASDGDLFKERASSLVSAPALLPPYWDADAELNVDKECTLYNVEVKTSTIPDAGKGIFATKTFQKDDVILPYYGRVYTGAAKQAKLQQQSALRSRMVSLKSVQDRYVLDGDPGCVATKVNHSPQPNALLFEDDSFVEPQELHYSSLSLRAMRTIGVAEEIFIDYGKAYWTGHESAVKLPVPDIAALEKAALQKGEALGRAEAEKEIAAITKAVNDSEVDED